MGCDLQAMHKDGAIPGDDLKQSNPGATSEQESTEINGDAAAVVVQEEPPLDGESPAQCDLQVNGESPAAAVVVQEATQLDGESPAQYDLKAMQKNGAVVGDDLKQSSLVVA